LILERGTLATRLLKAIEKDISEKHITSVFRQLQDCLVTNTLFKP
jgi:carboxylate-amine ligase